MPTSIALPARRPSLASKADLAATKTEIAELRMELKTEIADLRVELKPALPGFAGSDFQDCRQAQLDGMANEGQFSIQSSGRFSGSAR